MGRRKKNEQEIDIYEQEKALKEKMSSKKQPAGEKETENCEILDPDFKINQAKKLTTIDGLDNNTSNQILCKTAKGQNRCLDTEGIVKVDEDWLPKLLNLDGAGEKYKNIGENELKFIVNIIKYNNNIIAYKEAYDCTNLSKDYIEQRSSKLKARTDVADLLSILRQRMVKQTESQLQWQFSDSVNNLKFLIDTAKEEIDNCREDGKRSYLTLTRVTAIKDAVKELNQMMGYTEKSVKISNSVTIIGKEEDLTD